MFSAPHGIPLLARTTALFMAALLLVAPPARQSVSQAPPASANQAVVFFPPGAINGYDFLSQVLSQFNEPSLLAASQDSNALSYRLDSMAAQKWEFLAVRISISSDGSARVVAVELSGTPPSLHRTEHSASATEVKKFLQLVDKADFWSMPAIAPGKDYYRDADMWVFEGVRNGTYHVDMVRFLAKELAKLDESDIPH
jgi:hypothetical protein